MPDPIDTAAIMPDRVACDDRAPSDREALVARIRRLERGHDGGMSARTAPLGCAVLDDHLPGGALALGRVHELVGEARSEVRDAAVFGFACALLTRIAPHQTTILWCARRANVLGGAPSVRGLVSLGLDPGRVVFVDAGDEADRLWAMEEGLSTPGLGAVVAELDPARRGEVTASRRLQLAAEKSGVTGLILRPRLSTQAGACGRVPISVETRWRVAAAPSPFELHDLRPVWDVTLERARRGRPGRWTLAWDATAGLLEQAAGRPISTAVPAMMEPNTHEVAA